MTELTTKDSPIRVTVIEREKRILINRPDALIVLCFCGGARSIVLHVQASDARLPPLQPCTCAGETSVLPGAWRSQFGHKYDEVETPVPDVDNVDNMWTTGGKVEHLYAHLKREEP